MNSGSINKARYYVSILENEYKGSPILRRPESEVIQGRLNELRSKLSATNKIKGKITRVDLVNNFIIVATPNEETYIADNNDFIPRLSLLSKELIGKNVSFTPSEKTTNKGVRKLAKFIKID